MQKQFIVLILLAVSSASQAGGMYQHPDAFLTAAFDGKAPKPKFIWFTGDIGKSATTILNHKPASLRTRYWLKEKRSVWVLEEVGKEKPITIGIIINDNRIEKIKVLIFRESRGWEIKRNDFTKQFTNAELSNDGKLTQNIDGISGATLSVKAVTRLSRLSLYLHSQVTKNNGR